MKIKMKYAALAICCGAVPLSAQACDTVAAVATGYNQPSAPEGSFVRITCDDGTLYGATTSSIPSDAIQNIVSLASTAKIIKCAIVVKGTSGAWDLTVLRCE